VGPVLGGLLVDASGWPAAFVFRAPLFLPLAVLALTRVGRLPGARPAPRRLALEDVLRLPVLQSALLAFLSQYAQFAVWLLVPFFLVGPRGLSPSVGGAIFVLTPLATALAAPLGGALTDRFGPRGPLRAGLALEAAGLLAIATVGATTPLAAVGGGLALVGFGAGLFQVPNLALMMTAFPAAQQGAAGGLAFLARTLGSAVGVQAAAALFDARLPHGGFLTAFHATFVAAGAVCALAVAVALLPARARRVAAR
jgi:MFS family permease